MIEIWVVDLFLYSDFDDDDDGENSFVNTLKNVSLVCGLDFRLLLLDVKFDCCFNKNVLQ